MRKRISFLAKIDYLLYYPLIVLARRRVKEIKGLENIPNNGSLILAANHIDYLDGWLLGLFLLYQFRRKPHFITKSRNYLWAYKVTIPLTKFGPEECLKKSRNLVKENKMMVFFPEGQRNAEKTLLKGKTGAARLALWTKCPVIPVGLNGPSHSSFLKSVFQSLCHPKVVTITIGHPVDLTYFYEKEVTYELLTDCTKKMMQAIGELAGKDYPY